MHETTKDNEYLLITSQNFPYGGAGATYLNLFCRGLKSNGFTIDVILLKGFAFGNLKKNDHRKNKTEYGVAYNYLGLIQRPKSKLLKLFDDLLSLLNLFFYLFKLVKSRKNKCLLVYNNEFQSNLVIYGFARLFSIRLVTFVPEFYDRDDFKDSFFKRLKWHGFLYCFNHLNKLSDRLIVFTFYLREQFIKLGYDESKIFVQPNLTDFDYWEISKRIPKYTLGYSGAPYLKDGLYDLLKAVSIIKKEETKISLLVIGDSTFGKSLLPGLKAECDRLKISDNVTFTGLVESFVVKEYLSECNILAITRPSTIQTKAGFPTKLGEYFAVKRPVIATSFGDIEKYFNDGEDIVIAEAGNPGSIASKIKWMLENAQASETISLKGYLKAKELLDYKKSIKKLIKFINYIGIN